MEYNTTIEVNLSTRPDSIELTLSLEYEWCNDGIGHYEYWGACGYDHGTDYVEINQVTYDKAGFTAEEIADIDGCVGFILPGVQVEIVNGDEIRIKTPVMITEYVDNPSETAKHFRDGWFYPGDRGYLTKDNRLVITKTR